MVPRDFQGTIEVRRRLLWILLIGIGIAILVVIAQRGQGTVGALSADEFGSFAYKIALLVFLTAAAPR